MKKKLITALLLTMIISVVGCGKAEEAIEPTVETVEEAIEESVVEETTVEEVESTVEETTVEETTEEVVEDPTSEANSTAQILRLLNTYIEIMNGNDESAKYMQDNCETENGLWLTEEALFANGETALTTRTVVSIGIEYYKNCLLGKEPWDVKEWMSQQESDEYVVSMNFINGEALEGCDTRLWNAIYALPYLANQSSVTLENRIETNEYKFTMGEVSAYTYDLVLSGVEDTGFKAVYDSEGNLLNLVLPDDFVLETYSFDQNQ